METRIERLRAYERWRPPVPVDFETIVGSEVWMAYWQRLEAVDKMFAECQELAAAMGRNIAEARHGVRRAVSIEPAGDRPLPG